MVSPPCTIIRNYEKYIMDKYRGVGVTCKDSLWFGMHSLSWNCLPKDCERCLREERGRSESSWPVRPSFQFHCVSEICEVSPPKHLHDVQAPEAVTHLLNFKYQRFMTVSAWSMSRYVETMINVNEVAEGIYQCSSNVMQSNTVPFQLIRRSRVTEVLDGDEIRTCPRSHRSMTNVTKWKEKGRFKGSRLQKSLRAIPKSS